VTVNVAPIRDFVCRHKHRHAATARLTSRYMDDVVALSPRISVIHRAS